MNKLYQLARLRLERLTIKKIIPGKTTPKSTSPKSDRRKRFEERILSLTLFFNKKTTPKSTSPKSDRRKRFEERAFSFTRFSIKEQTHFAKRLAFLVNSGVPILDSLHMIRKQTKGRGKQKIFDAIIEDISEGKNLSKSLSRFPRFFGSFAINIIQIGESGGLLSQNLEYLAEELRKKHELRKKVLGALIYPIFISVSTLLLVGLMTIFIFPKIMPIFQSLSVELPFTTRVLLASSNFLLEFGWYVLGGIILFIILFWQLYSRVLPFHYAINIIVLRLPIAGKIAKSYYTANFCRTLGLLLRSGTGVVDAVSMTGGTMGNLVYERECRIMAEKVMRGEKISKHLETRQHIFPDIIGNMVAIGEESGKLSDTLMYLSEMYESEVDDLTKNLSSSIEPVLMIFMGIIVGFVAVSVITPIYEVTKNLSL